MTSAKIGKLVIQDNRDGTDFMKYDPSEEGCYEVVVKYNGEPVQESPFKFYVDSKESGNATDYGPGVAGETTNSAISTKGAGPSKADISYHDNKDGTVLVRFDHKHVKGDAKKVKVSGTGLKEGQTHSDNIFSVDTRNAGFGGLSVSIEGPSKAEIQCTDKDDGTLNISYKPTEPGYYIVNLKFADHHVEGSPFTVKVSGEGSHRKREKIQRERDAVPLTEINTQCKLTFKMPGITSFDLAACVTSPSNVTEDAEILELEDGVYSVHFLSKEVGVHSVTVRCSETHIPGSPFQFTVGPLRDCGSHLVKAGGSGLKRGVVGEAAEFNVWTRDAGVGSLAISINGPSKADMEFKDRKDGSCDVSYKVTEPGKYRVGLKFNGRHIPDSPFKVYISPDAGDAHKLEVQQLPQGNIQADVSNRVKGEMDDKIVTFSGTDEVNEFIQVNGGDMNSVRCHSRENANHGVLIPDPPLRIKFGQNPTISYMSKPEDQHRVRYAGTEAQNSPFDVQFKNAVKDCPNLKDCYDNILDLPIVSRSALVDHLCEGMRFTFIGQIGPKCDDFSINFVYANKAEDIALQINPRFYHIVRNTKMDGSWGNLEGTIPTPFTPAHGSRFKIEVLVTKDHYLIITNDQHCAEYKHRLPFKDVRILRVDGEVELFQMYRTIVSGHNGCDGTSDLSVNNGGIRKGWGRSGTSQINETPQSLPTGIPLPTGAAGIGDSGERRRGRSYVRQTARGSWRDLNCLGRR